MLMHHEEIRVHQHDYLYDGNCLIFSHVVFKAIHSLIYSDSDI
ncbi:Uncharacterised protein [Citrobacter freundii]|nr:Uncharacterised protein [Citrobacter freundii]SUX69869.1 Uncharacterised protein [Citrobacter freundii]